MIYFIARFLLNISMHIYFRKILVLNKEKNFHPDRPTIVVMNHPNAFLDALFLVIQRFNKVFKLGQAGLYQNPWMKRVYNAFRIMPIYRQRDGAGGMQKNEEIFKQAIKKMSKNSLILVYAEGNPSMEFGLRPLKKGAARLAFQAQNELNQAIQIVILGVTYGNRRRFRTEAVLSFGEPIYTDKTKKGSPDDINELTKQIEVELKAQIPVSKLAQTNQNAYNELKTLNHHGAFTSYEQQHQALLNKAVEIDQEGYLPKEIKTPPADLSCFKNPTDWFAALVCFVPGIVGLVLYAPFLRTMQWVGEKVPKDKQFIASLKVATLLLFTIPYTSILASFAYFIDGLTFLVAYLMISVSLFASLILFDFWNDIRAHRFFKA